MPCLRENLAVEANSVVLPPELEELLLTLPVRMDRRTLADVITRHFFPVSYRTLEAWPLPTQCVNGKAIVPTIKGLRIAFAMLNAAPVVMSGRRAPVVRKVPS
ncbi:MAG: hypothetical protein EXR07_02070 [Acetobacteraceae bacterium]|nr:hypothetical protein [Acetobacteraceae bacterium]